MSRHSRTSFSHALRRVVHATEDLVDDTLDRAGDFEHGMRDSLSKALDDDPDDRDRWGARDRWDDRDRWGDRDRWNDRDGREHRGPRGRGGRREPRDRRPDDGPREGRERADDRPYGPNRRQTGDADEFRALRDQISVLAGRIEQRGGETGEEWAGRGSTPVPQPRNTDDARSIKDELSRLADRIDRASGVAR